MLEGQILGICYRSFFNQGKPAKSSSSVVEVSIVDVNDNKPLFESSFYDVQLAEDVKPGHCFLTVKI